ncbi:glycosyltransferase family 39 protein [Oscillospiraceae bacterium OttesenSCG-928-F05]|nr:glycosyltransferase family 39 protein [Oscillospiraceae bacterium OttesenSCG-928-F05]
MGSSRSRLLYTVQQSFETRAAFALFAAFVSVFLIGALAFAARGGAAASLLSLIGLCSAVLLGLAPAPRRAFYVFFIAVSLMLRLSFCLAVQTAPVSDFLLLYEAAESAATGDFSVLNTLPYFQNWAYQTGFVAWMAALIRLFGADVLFLQCLNCLLQTATALVVYATARNFFGERPGRISAWLFAFSPEALLLVPVLSNQHLSTFLFCAGFLVWLKALEKRPLLPRCLLGAAAGLLCAMGQVIRPVGEALFLAVAATLLLVFFADTIRRRWEALRQRAAVMLPPLFAAGLAFLLAFTAAGQAVRLSGLNQNGLTNGFPEWKLVLGLNSASGGMYNDADLDIYTITDPALRKQVAREVIAERLRPGDGALLKLTLKKTLRFWGSGGSAEWIVSEGSVGVYGRTAEFFAAMPSMYHAVLYALLLGFALARVQKKDTDIRTLWLIALIGVYAGIHFLIEIQPRYRDFAMPAVMILSGGAVERLYCLASRRQKRPLGAKKT